MSCDDDEDEDDDDDDDDDEQIVVKGIMSRRRLTPLSSQTLLT